MEAYVKARHIAITTSNILDGWRGAGLFPTNKQRILRQLSDKHKTPSPSLQFTTPMTFLNNSSPANVLILRSANVAFNNALSRTTAGSPVKTHEQCLGEITEKLYAENAILRKDNSELRAQIRSRKEWTKGKRLVLKDLCAIATKEVHKALEEAQKATKAMQKGKNKGKRATAKEHKKVSSSEEEDTEDTDNDSAEAIEIRDCINVRSQ